MEPLNFIWHDKKKRAFLKTNSINQIIEICLQNHIDERNLALCLWAFLEAHFWYGVGGSTEEGAIIIKEEIEKILLGKNLQNVLRLYLPQTINSSNNIETTTICGTIISEPSITEQKKDPTPPTQTTITHHNRASGENDLSEFAIIADNFPASLPCTKATFATLNERLAELPKTIKMIEELPDKAKNYNGQTFTYTEPFLLLEKIFVSIIEALNIFRTCPFADCPIQQQYREACEALKAMANSSGVTVSQLLDLSGTLSVLTEGFNSIRTEANLALENLKKLQELNPVEIQLPKSPNDNLYESICFLNDIHKVQKLLQASIEDQIKTIRTELNVRVDYLINLPNINSENKSKILEFRKEIETSGSINEISALKNSFVNKIYGLVLVQANHQVRGTGLFPYTLDS